MEYTHIDHPFPPLYDENSRILILGSFPSVKSREQLFFYGHKMNRFWRIISLLFGEEKPETVPEKRAFLLKHRIALWDVIQSCDIKGSSDSSIKNAIPTDLSEIFETAGIRAVFCNGGTSGKLYEKYQLKRTGIPAETLPSTSPANAAWNEEKLLAAWQKVREALEE